MVQRGSNDMHAGTSLAPLQFQKNKESRLTPQEPYATVLCHELAADGDVQEEVTDEVDFLNVVTEVVLFPFKLC
jgi:hypothetical protein